MKKLIVCGIVAVGILGAAAFTPAIKTVACSTVLKDIPDCSAGWPPPCEWDPIGKRCVCGPSLLWNKTKHFVGR